MTVSTIFRPMENNEILEKLFMFLSLYKSNMTTIFTESGLSAAPVHMKLLQLIESMPNCTAQDVVKKIQRDKGQINKIIKDLALKGYISKEANTKDKRSHFLIVTQAGLKTLKVMNKIQKDFTKKITKNIPNNELKNFISTIDKITDNLN